jgi:hypothetical protein
VRSQIETAGSSKSVLLVASKLSIRVGHLAFSADSRLLALKVVEAASSR